MRRAMLLAVIVLVATVGEAQVLWVGAGAGTSWEYHAASAPDQTFKHDTELAPTVFVALPLADDTLLRLRVADVPHDRRIGADVFEGRVRSYTLGVDYMMGGVLGEATVSAGLGSYTFLPKGARNTWLEEHKFGYYVGIGEWFTVTSRARVTGEITLHRPEVQGKPSLVSLVLGFAYSF